MNNGPAAAFRFQLLFSFGRSQRRPHILSRVAGLRPGWLRPAGSASRCFFCTFWWQKVPKTIRTSVSRVLRSSSLKRAPDAGLQANRPRFSTLGLRLGQTPLRPIVRSLSCRCAAEVYSFSAHSPGRLRAEKANCKSRFLTGCWLRAAGLRPSVSRKVPFAGWGGRAAGASRQRDEAGGFAIHHAKFIIHNRGAPAGAGGLRGARFLRNFVLWILWL